MKRTNKRSWTLLVSLLVVFIAAVGVTMAFLIDSTNAVENVFKPSKVTTSVEETLENNEKKDVFIQNTGDTAAYIRATVQINWQDQAGNVCGETPVVGTDYTIDPSGLPSNLPSGWFKGDDGFYYYEKAVEPQGSTGNLINSVTQLKTKEINGTTYYLTVTILASGIQSEPAAAVQEAWPAVEVSTEAATKGQLQPKS